MGRLVATAALVYHARRSRTQAPMGQIVSAGTPGDRAPGIASPHGSAKASPCMRIPDTLLSLVDYGIIDEVLRPLMSGKEAQIYLINSGGQLRVAKVYKEAQNRTFKNRAEYT